MTINRTFSTFNIAGFTYEDGIDVFNELEIGTHLFFATEPTNPYDPNAVAICFSSPKLEKNVKLGFIPRDKNEVISKLLHCGHRDIFEVQVNRIAREEHPEKQVSVVVRIKLNEN